MSGWRLSITLWDKGTDTSTVTINMNPAVVTDYVTASARMAAYIPLLLAMTDATIKKSSLIEDWTPNPNPSYPPDGDYVSTKAHLQYGLGANLAKMGYHDVPAPSQGIFLNPAGPGSDHVDIADAAVNAYNTWMAANALLSDGETVGGYTDGWKLTRKSDRRN